MFAKKTLIAIFVLCTSAHVWADEAAPVSVPNQAAVTKPAAPSTVSMLMERASSYLGIKYRMGGDGPTDGGFDCSGLVRKVFGDAIGLNLPRTAQEMAALGDKVGDKSDLKPGDLVFFKTMRRTFSHVGIYLGDNRFVHAPSAGGRVRVDDMRDSYWVKAFKGARRLVPEAHAATLPAVPQTTTVPGIPGGESAGATRDAR